jgi:GTPase SAR1 family protein
MPRVVIGEPGTGKTTFAINFSLEAFFRGYGALVVDVADGKLVDNILSSIPPDQRWRVMIKP